MATNTTAVAVRFFPSSIQRFILLTTKLYLRECTVRYPESHAPDVFFQNSLNFVFIDATSNVE